MNIEQATILFLVAVFVAAEIYRALRSTRGTIIALDNTGLGDLAPVFAVKVRLEEGREIDANLNFCTACIGRLKIGDDVRVCASGNGYVADLPWFRRKRCSTTSAENNRLCRSRIIS